MTVSVTMLQSRWGEDGTLWAVDTVHDATDSFATYLVTNGFASGTLPLPLQSTPVSHVILTASEIDALAGDAEPGWTYEDRATGGVYRADRSGNLAAQAGTVNVGGIEYLTLSDGSRLPLSIMAGTPHEPMIAAVVNQVLTVDAGSDADHAELLWTFNATTGDPDTADTALMSARFSDPDGNAEVVKSAIDGATAGAALGYSSSGFTMVHFALRGAGPYTAAAGATCTALQAVLMKWADSLNVTVVEIRVGTSYVGAGSNKRYRQITVTGYSA